MSRSESQDQPLFDEAFLRRLERLTLCVRRISGLSGGRPGALRVPAADFVDYRPYTFGDDPRHIHWAAVARLDEVYVKVGRRPQSADVCVLLDVSASMAADSEKAGMALQLAAALGWIALHAGDRLSLIEFGEAVASAWGPGVGSSRGPGLLSYLGAPAAPRGAVTRLQAACRQAARTCPAGGLAVVISDLWLSDDLGAALAVLAPPRWDTLVLQVLGHGEAQPLPEGDVLLKDAETGELLDLDVDQAMADRYRVELNARVDRMRAVAAGRGARHEWIPAEWTLERAVVPYLLARSVLEG